jgi:hypothetical protein
MLSGAKHLPVKISFLAAPFMTFLVCTTLGVLRLAKRQAIQISPQLQTSSGTIQTNPLPNRRRFLQALFYD